MLTPTEQENPQIAIERLAHHRLSDQVVDDVLSTRIRQAENKGLIAQLFQLLFHNRNEAAHSITRYQSLRKRA